MTLFGGTPLITRGAVEIFRHDWSLDSSEAIRDLGYTHDAARRRRRAHAGVDSHARRPARS